MSDAGSWRQNAIHDDGAIRAFAWTRANGRPTSPKALISAHGSSAFINGDFPSGDYQIFYYCAHGYNLNDPGLTAFVKRSPVPTEEFSSATSKQDYGLTQYQEKGGTETYADVQALPTSFHMDVITIKNYYSDITLIRDSLKFSDLIRLLQKNGYNYQQFHCSFCRGTAWTWIQGTILGQPTSQGANFFSENKLP